MRWDVFCFASKLSSLNATPREKQEGKGIKTANYVYYIEYLAKRLQFVNASIGSTLPTDK
jgi:hypothetical protein